MREKALILGYWICVVLALALALSAVRSSPVLSALTGAVGFVFMARDLKRRLSKG